MLDMQPMNEACQLIRGQHDFASFASSLEGSKSTLRNVYEAGMKKRGDFAVFRVVANSFLPHQVRSTVGLLIRLGLGKMGIADFRDIMEARILGLAGPLSPACGLYLMKVNYAKPVGELALS